jgi:hypothetical protein
MRTPLALLLFVALAAHAQVSVTVDSSVKFQTIEGWGHGSAFIGTGWGAIDAVDSQFVDFVVDDWGLTGTRVNEIGARGDGSGLDHGVCDSIDWSRMNLPGNKKIMYLMQYVRDRVRAQGYEPSFYSSTNYAQLASFMKPWILNHPGERAQEMWASAMYYRDSFGIDTKYAVVANEPSGSWTAPVIAEVIKAAGPRFVAHGLPTKSQFAEGVDAHTSWNYITAVRGDTDLWPWVGRLSYHNYGTSDPYRAYMKAFGDSIGLTTAQTEMDPANIDNLFDDLLKGGVSYWETAFTNGSTVSANAGYTSFTPTRYYYRVRQVLHYVRPGAVRIGTTTTDTLVRMLAFVDKGKITTIVYNTSSASKSVTVHGIPPGTYGISQALSGVIAFEEHGVNTVGADGALTITIPAYADATIYPYSGPNHPPTMMTWGTNPGTMHLPTTTSQLSATASDPEMDSLTYAWRVVSEPGGAAAVLATPNKATTNVSGLTAGGTYVFNVDVSDGVNTVSRKAYLIVYASNQPPAFNYTGFRFSSPYGVILDLPHTDGTMLNTTITLPNTSGLLQANISDPENDPLAGLWRIVSQPAGGTATLDSTFYIYVSYRAQIRNMSVPGEYVFEISAHDTSNAPITCRVACTVLVQNTAPKIDSLLGLPAVITLPVHATQLHGVTSDAEHDLLRQWWMIKNVPAGARPQFDHQGLSNSGVSGLTLPGSYTFTLRLMDDISMTTRDVTIRVNPPTSVNEAPRTVPHGITLGQNIPNPAVSVTTIPFTLDKAGFVSLKIYDVLGREVATLLSRRFDAGTHQTECNTVDLQPGRYLYRLTAGSETATGGMVVVK